MRRLFVTVLSLLALSSCREDEGTNSSVKSLDLTNYFIGGTTVGTPKSMNKSVYIIQFLENNKALFSSSSTDLVADYELTKDSLIVTVNDPNNYRVAKYAINGKNEITSAYYKALKKEYEATGALIKIDNHNHFAKNTYSGTEYRWGSVFNKEWFYRFDDKGKNYGVGKTKEEVTIDREMSLINNAAYRYKGASFTEIGFVSGDSLVTSRVQGLYFYGVYKKVK